MPSLSAFLRLGPQLIGSAPPGEEIWTVNAIPDKLNTGKTFPCLRYYLRWTNYSSNGTDWSGIELSNAEIVVIWLCEKCIACLPVASTYLPVSFLMLRFRFSAQNGEPALSALTSSLDLFLALFSLLAAPCSLHPFKGIFPGFYLLLLRSLTQGTLVFSWISYFLCAHVLYNYGFFKLVEISRSSVQLSVMSVGWNWQFLSNTG